MASTRVLRRRIRSIRATKQITRAMEMVATSKLRAATRSAQASVTYADELERLVQRVLPYAEHPWSTPTNGPTLVIVLASDQGLTGSFHGNLLRQAIQLESELRAAERQPFFLPIGKRMVTALTNVGFQIHNGTPMSREPHYADAEALAWQVAEIFQSGVAGEIYLLSTRYRSALLQEIIQRKLLPLNSELNSLPEPLLEPSAGETLSALLPQWLAGQLITALLNSKASEFAAQRVAMHAATDNAGKLIDKLTLTYNRARQAAITTEIAEIVGGASALNT